MKQVFALVDKEFNEKLSSFVSNFSTEGVLFDDGTRNTIKTVAIGNETINVKSFKKPNLVNKIVYRFFRKSKAERSYRYAKKLLEMGIGTPEPYAYFENSSGLLFKESYYACKHLDYDLIIRDVSFKQGYVKQEEILRAFTRFCYELHKKGINFLDHSAGNTLIKLNNNTPDFFLVDLNRMRFETMDFETRMKNLRKLTIHESVVKIMSNEYAKCSGEDEDRIFNSLWKETQEFQHRFDRKKQLKKKLKFWKK